MNSKLIQLSIVMCICTLSVNAEEKGHSVLSDYRLIFSSDMAKPRDLYTIDGDGKNVFNVSQDSTINNQTPMPSSDGKYVTLFTGEEKNADLSIMSLDGKKHIKLMENETTEYYSSWSPDDKKIVFSSDRSGESQLYIMGLNDKQVTRLTHDNYYNSHPMWAPGTAVKNKNKILFHSIREKAYHLFLIDHDGKNQKQITHPPLSPAFAKWFPDGDQIAFESRAPGADGSDIFVMDVNTGSLAQITEHEADDTMPSVSYDGRMIAFISNRTGNYEIYIHDLVAKKLHQVTDHGFTIYHPQFLAQ